MCSSTLWACLRRCARPPDWPCVLVNLTGHSSACLRADDINSFVWIVRFGALVDSVDASVLVWCVRVVQA